MSRPSRVWGRCCQRGVRADRKVRRPEVQNGEHGGDLIAALGQPDSHEITRLDGVGEFIGQRQGRPVQLGVGEGVTVSGIDDRGGVGSLLDSFEERSVEQSIGCGRSAVEGPTACGGVPRHPDDVVEGQRSEGGGVGVGCRFGERAQCPEERRKQLLADGVGVCAVPDVEGDPDFVGGQSKDLEIA